MIAALHPSETLAGHEPIRPASGGGLVYRHACGGECLVWDIMEDGKLELECECGRSPVELADDFGISHDRLKPIDFAISAQMLAERALVSDPDDKAALALLAITEP